MTYKVKIFLFAFKIWTWILFYLTRMFNYGLGLILVWIPDDFVPSLNSIYNNKNIYILGAKDSFGRTITNKLNLFSNLKWDKTSNDIGGSVDLDMFCKYIGSAIIWVAYFTEADMMPKKYEVFMDKIHQQNFKSEDIHALIRTAIIDVSNKLIHKMDATDFRTTTDNIYYGEVEF